MSLSYIRNSVLATALVLSILTGVLLAVTGLLPSTVTVLLFSLPAGLMAAHWCLLVRFAGHFPPARPVAGFLDGSLALVPLLMAFGVLFVARRRGEPLVSAVGMVVVPVAATLWVLYTGYHGFAGTSRRGGEQA